MEGDSTRTCPSCAETVKAAAKLCPYCRSDLRRSAIRVRVSEWVAWLCLLLFFFGALMLFYRFVRPWEDFTKHRNQVTVSSSSIQFSDAGDRGKFVTTIGTVKNESDWAWKNLQVEVRYFNQEGKLIDVGVQTVSDTIVQPHSESGFRVRTLADQPDSVYVSHKAVVRSAKDERSWP
jgi:hypothetical protein